MSTKTWNGATADWTDAADWSGGQPGSGDTALINGGDATIGATDTGIVVNSITLSAPGVLTIADSGQAQTVNGALASSGTLDVDVTGSGGSTLRVGGTLTNSGSPALGVFIGNTAITTATAVDIVGLANSGGLILTGGSATATASLALSGTGSDSGAITMNAFADLVVSGALTLDGGSITGGVLTTTGGGVIETGGGGIAGALSGVTIATGSTYTDTEGTLTAIGGTLTNHGEILVDSTGASTDLEIAAAGATLTGGGLLLLSNENTNFIQSEGSGAPTLANVNNTIEGAGEINGIAVDNQAAGVIDADQTSALTISTAANTFDNEGVLEATNGATLALTNATITQTGNGGSGAVEAIGAGSKVTLEGATIVGGALAASGGGVIQSGPGGDAGALIGVTISPGVTYSDTSGTGTSIGGAIVNAGEIFVDSTTAEATELNIEASGAALTGGGQVLLSNDTTNVIEAVSGTPTLTNVDNTIAGAGVIEGVTVNNEVDGVIDADQTSALTISTAANTFDNEGVLEATNGATLALSDAAVTQTGAGGSGVVEAIGAGSAVKLEGGAITGGTLIATGGGVIQSIGGGYAGVLTGVTIANGTSYTDTNQTVTTIGGTLTNEGEILVDSTGLATYLEIAASGAALAGDGVLQLSNDNANFILPVSGTPALTNVNNTIEGAGVITGLGSFNNEAGGIVDADQSTALVLQAISGVLTNSGIFEASGGATLRVLDSIAGHGQLPVQTASTIELDGATAEATSFVGADGTLLLDTPTTYTGVIHALAVGDTLELGGVDAISATPTLDGGYTTLTVNLSGGGALTYTLVGNYSEASFSVVDGDKVIISSSVPVISSAGNTVIYTQGAPAIAVDGALALADASNGTLTGASVTISGGFLAGDQLNFTNMGAITGDYSASTGVLTLSGAASLAAYQTALRSITFSSTNDDPTNSATDPDRMVSWQVKAGALASADASSTINVVGLYRPPVVTAGETVSYTQGGAAVRLDGALTVSDAGASALTGASVAIANGFLAGDQLKFTNQAGITGSYDAATGVMSLTGAASVAAYQTALRSITFSSTSANPAASSRQIDWQASDQIAGGPDEVSNIATSTVNVPAVSQPAWTTAASGNWNAPANWTPKIVPGPTSVVSIGGAVTYTITTSLNDAAAALNITDPYAAVDINDTTFTLIGPQVSANHGVVSVGGPQGLLVISGTIDNTNASGLLVPSDTGSPAVAATNGATIDLDGGSIFGGRFAISRGADVIVTGGSLPSTIGEALVEIEKALTSEDGTALTLLNSQVSLYTLAVLSASGAGSTIALVGGTVAGVDGGEVLASGAGAKVTLDGATAEALTFMTSSGGVIGTVAGSNSVLDDFSIVSGSVVTVSDNSSVTLEGSYTDSNLASPTGGALALDSTGDATTLFISGTVILNGAGEITLSDNKQNIVTAASTASAELINNNDTIKGAGQLGDGSLTLDNQAGGLIEETGSAGLTINTGGGATTNAGTIQAFGAGGVVIDSPLDNTGTLIANAGTLAVNGAVTGTGHVNINGGTADFGGPFGENVVFTGATGVLELSQAYGGEITGLSPGGTNSIVLRGVTYDGVVTAAYSGSVSSGVLTVTEGTEVATIHLEGNYLTSTFTLSAAPGGGTLIVDPAKTEAPTVPYPIGPAHQFIAAMAGLGASAGGFVGVGGELWRTPSPTLVGSRARA